MADQVRVQVLLSRDEAERGEFSHRLRVVPEDVADWRQRTVRFIAEHREVFPAVSSRVSETEIRDRLDEGIVRLRELARILAGMYQTPRLGNPTEPVDELVYIILARKTHETAYQRTFQALKSRFSTWDALLRARPHTVARLVKSGGLASKKTKSLFGALHVLRDTFGSCTLEPARDWDDERLVQFLCQLPEISLKSAYCIMLYAFDRAVFPVDTHVGRLLARIRAYRELGLDLDPHDHKRRQALLADLIPPNLRYGLHVNLIAHGRAVCHGQRPRCDQCVIRTFCATGTELVAQAEGPVATRSGSRRRRDCTDDRFAASLPGVTGAPDSSDGAPREPAIRGPAVADEHGGEVSAEQIGGLRITAAGLDLVDGRLGELGRQANPSGVDSQACGGLGLLVRGGRRVQSGHGDPVRTRWSGWWPRRRSPPRRPRSRRPGGRRC